MYVCSMQTALGCTVTRDSRSMAIPLLQHEVVVSASKEGLSGTVTRLAQ